MSKPDISAIAVSAIGLAHMLLWEYDFLERRIALNAVAGASIGLLSITPFAKPKARKDAAQAMHSMAATIGAMRARQSEIVKQLDSIGSQLGLTKRVLLHN